jgi:hypothetical protein
MDKRFLIPLIAASFLGASSAASADETINFLGSDQADIFNIQFGSLNENVYVGSLKFTTASDPHAFDLYCVDLDHDIWAGNSYDVELIDTATLPDGDPYKLAGDIYSANFRDVTDSDQAAALQIALWEAIAPGDFSVTNAPTSIMDMAQDDYNAGLSYHGSAILYQEIGGDGQSQIGAVPGPSGALVLLVGTLGGAVQKRRR